MSGHLDATGWADAMGERHKVEAVAHDMVAHGAEIAAEYAAVTVEVVGGGESSDVANVAEQLCCQD